MPAPVLQDPLLTWGVLSFVGPGESDSAFTITAMVGGTHFGNPVAVVEQVKSLLIDGAQAAVTGYDNREAPIRLKLSGNDGEALAQAEAAIVQQCNMDRPEPLVFTPPIGLAAPCVFDVVVAVLEHDTADGWDIREIKSGDRFYQVTFTCLPFVRAVEATVIPALPVPVDPEDPVWVDIDTCGSTTGWARETNGGSPSGPSVGSYLGESWVEATAYIDNPNDHLRLVRTGAVSVPADHYLVVDVHSYPELRGWRLYDGTTYHDPIGVLWYGGPLVASEDPSHRLFFDVGGLSTSQLKFLIDFDSYPFADVTIRVLNIAYTDTLGTSTTTTNRQQSRLVTVPGSMPTQSQVRLYDATPADLAAPAGTTGDILVYTSRNTGWRPNLRTWIDDSEPDADDPTLVSGARHTLATPTKFLIPAELIQLATYALVARMNLLTAGTLSWQARMATLGGATNAVGSAVIVSGEVELPATGSNYKLFDLAALILPVVEVEGSNYAIELNLTGTADMTMDEAWLFSLDDGAVTWVEDYEGMDWIEIRSPELGAARPSVWGGRNAVGTGASCIDWKCRSFGSHRFEPGQMQIFTVCTASLKAQCEMELFPRFHSYVWGGETS